MSPKTHTHRWMLPSPEAGAGKYAVAHCKCGATKENQLMYGWTGKTGWVGLPAARQRPILPAWNKHEQADERMR